MELFKRVLVLAPHTDDGEVGCGGSIAKMVQQGQEVYMAAFSVARTSVPRGFPPDALKGEICQAIKCLGVPDENLIIFDYDVRHFPAHRQEILEDMVKLKRDLAPDLVLLPASTDIHQDHQVISAEGLRAFKQATVLGYEEPWNNLDFNTSGFVKLNCEHIEAKIAALKCYHSQMHRNYLDEELVRSLARIRGSQFQVEWAEAFEVMRFVMR